MNMPLAKCKYLEAQISGKPVNENKVGEYLVFSLFQNFEVFLFSLRDEYDFGKISIFKGSNI